MAETNPVLAQHAEDAPNQDFMFSLEKMLEELGGPEGLSIASQDLLEKVYGIFDAERVSGSTVVWLMLNTLVNFCLSTTPRGTEARVLQAALNTFGAMVKECDEAVEKIMEAKAQVKEASHHAPGHS